MNQRRMIFLSKIFSPVKIVIRDREHSGANATDKINRRCPNVPRGLQITRTGIANPVKCERFRKISSDIFQGGQMLFSA